MALKNPWIKYVDRPYRSIKDNILTRFQNQVPEITDHSESNTWVKGIGIWAGLSEHLGYYVDNAARETFLETQRRFESAAKLANQFDYRVKGRLPAFVELTFTSNVITTTIINIPAGTKVSTDKGITFETLENVSINVGENSVKVDAKQWIIVLNAVVGTSDGSILQKFPLEVETVDKEMLVTVGGTESFIFVDSFAFTMPTDQVFRPALNVDNILEIQFGDGVQGAIPGGGDDIVCTYYVTEGFNGNVGGSTIVNIDSSLTLPSGIELVVTNENPAAGGKDSEGLSDIQKNIPLTIRTKDRAVTFDDFIDTANRAPGVLASGVNYDCGKFVDVYIVPEGGGFPSQALIESTELWFDDRTPILLKVRVSGAGTLSIEITANVTANSNFLNSAIKSDIENNLLAFFEPINQEVNGRVVIGDIYQVIENTTGVKNSAITFFNPIPFALPSTTTANTLSWTRTVKQASVSTVKWEIKFIAVDEFEVKREGTFLGTFDVDLLLMFSEIDFTIIGNYDVNDIYTFVTYPYNQNIIQLDEASIPATEISVLNINVTGGI